MKNLRIDSIELSLDIDYRMNQPTSNPQCLLKWSSPFGVWFMYAHYLGIEKHSWKIREVYFFIFSQFFFGRFHAQCLVTAHGTIIMIFASNHKYLTLANLRPKQRKPEENQNKTNNYSIKRSTGALCVYLVYVRILY